MAATADLRARRADAIDRRITALVDVGVGKLAREGTRTLARIVIAYRNDRPLMPLLVAQRDALARATTEGMIAAHAAGSFAVLVDAEASRLKSLANPYDNAVEAARKKAKLSAEQEAKLRRVYTPAALRIATDVSDEVEQRLRIAVAEIVEKNLHVDAAVRALGKAYRDAGMVAAKPYRLETTVRTQIQLAYSAGAVEADRDPAVDSILWGYEYATVGDDRVRPNHEALDGVRLPKADPQWARIMPPNGFNCRCTALRVFDEEVEPLGGIVPVPDIANVDGEAVKAGPDKGWEFNAGDFYRHLDGMTDAQLEAAAKAAA